MILSHDAWNKVSSLAWEQYEHVALVDHPDS